VKEYVECMECRFVVLSTGGPAPEPERVDACPNCDSTEFAFPGENQPDPGSRTGRRSGLES
jgi:hypothetical protein